MKYLYQSPAVQVFARIVKSVRLSCARRAYIIRRVCCAVSKSLSRKNTVGAGSHAPNRLSRVLSAPPTAARLTVSIMLTRPNLSISSAAPRTGTPLK